VHNGFTNYYLIINPEFYVSLIYNVKN